MKNTDSIEVNSSDIMMGNQSYFELVIFMKFLENSISIYHSSFNRY